MGTSHSPEFMFRSKLGSQNKDGISKALVEPMAPRESLAPPEAWKTLQCWWVNLLQSSCPVVSDGAGSQPGQREAAPAPVPKAEDQGPTSSLLWVRPLVLSDPTTCCTQDSCHPTPPRQCMVVTPG